jgi:hypothetical protein
MSKRFETLEELESWLRSPQRREFDIQYICVEGGGIVLVARRRKSGQCLRLRPKARCHQGVGPRP